MTSKAEIEIWFDKGVANQSTHMMVVCDTFDYDDYPVYSTSAAQALEKYSEYGNKPMQEVMEVYDLSASKAEQLGEHRTLRLPTAESPA
jgi:hypothetical protein